MRKTKNSNFRDIGEFHEKFGIPTVGDGPRPRLLDPEAERFRRNFLAEELAEVYEGYEQRDLAKVADGLVDLVVVALGTAHMHGLPWQALWDEVQRANMSKERCQINHPFIKCYMGDSCQHGCHLEGCGKPRVEHSLRGSSLDIIKPASWTGPDIVGVLTAAGWPGRPLPFEKEAVAEVKAMAEGACPKCHCILAYGEVDIGVGVQQGNHHCPNCGWEPKKPDMVCEHGVAMDVHCCNCHTGFIFDEEHECPEVEK